MRFVSPVSGVVSLLYVEHGASVVEEERLMALESMKTTFDVYAPCSGRVKYNCQLGQVVAKRQVLGEVV